MTNYTITYTALRRNSSFFSFLFLLTVLVTSANSALGQVVISQIYGGGGNSGATYQNDFIELYNQGTTPVSLNGWSVQYAPANGNPTAWSNSNSTYLTNITLNPGQYYLIQEAGGTSNLPIPDATGTIAIAATGGKVALCNSTTTLTSNNTSGGSIIDFVGFGNANASEGTSTNSPSNTTSVIRLNGGCTDTNVNSADLVTGFPTPRNSTNYQIICNSPTSQASNIIFSTVSKSTIIVNWTNGNGSGRIVFMKEGSGTNTNPVNGTAYSANANWESKGTQLGVSGYYCIYNGTGSTVSLTNLIAGATYSLQVFEYFGTGNYCNYNTSTAANNPNYQTTANFLVTNPTTFATTTSSTTQINLSATANTNSDNIIIVSNSTGSFATPTDGVAAGNIGDTFAGGTIIYKGSAASITNHTGLTSNTTYYYKAFSYDGSNNYSSGLTANATTAKIEPINQPTGIGISTIITSTSIPLIWTHAATGSQAPDGYFVKLSTGTITDPIDGTDPGTGSTTINLGNAEYKTPMGASFTNAIAGTMYNVKVYSYTNSGGLIDFNTNSAATFNIATPPNSVSSASLTATGSTSANITWSPASGYDHANHSTLVFVKATNSINTGSPTNAPSTYSANTVLGNGTAYQNDASATCVYNGDGTNVTVTGLSANTTYHVLIYTVVDATNSNSKNAYSYSTTASGTTSNLPAPTANTASMISATGFTANWNPIDGAVNYKLDVSTLPIFGTATPSTITEGFNSGTTPSANWIFTAIGGTYTATGNYGTSSPSLQLDATSDRILTPTLNGPATQLSFWIKGQSTDAASALLIEGYNGSAWVTIKSITNSIPTTGTTYTFNSGSTPVLPAYIIQFRFTYTKSAGNISFDDVSINYDVISPSIIEGYNNLDAGNITSQSVTGLSPNTTYYYRVRATSANSTSANSNTIAATTSNTFLVNSTVSASALPVCSTCDVSVSSGALLNIDASKTFNAITVEPGGKLTNAVGSTLSATTLNLKSNVSETATYLDNGTTQITASNVEQYLISGRNWYVSSPVHSANINALSTASSIVHWDETIGNWATPSTTLNPMRGYISVATNDSKAITFSGTLNNGEKTIELTRTSGKTKEGFNLVGNPYPSYLNWTSPIATAANALTTIWYRTQIDGIYEFHTYNATGGIGIPNGITGIIPPMQGFWVRVNTGGGTLTTNNNMRSHGNGSNPIKARTSTNTQQKILRLTVSNTTNSDETVVYFNPDASDNYDAFDSPKMTNVNASIPEIFTMAETEKVAINGLNSLTMDKELLLGFSTDEINTFTIRANEVSNFDENMKVILKDKLLNKEQDLSYKESYTFTSNPVTTTSRFSLIFRTASTITNINNTENEHDIVIYKNGSNQIVVSHPGNISPENSVLVYNTLGQLLTSKQLTGKKTVIQLPSQPGIFIVTAMNGKKCITKKVVIK